ncbi:zinc finger CCCH domain-containing protein 7B [Salvelinus sp. IW2-2015]|uniref:zinc finger CCCH domain-containing protein 7B n=1 Tax=Salvelinus sp. IW2-2015 TaxID=2691554 RepID=UPI0038D3F149
MDLDRQKRQEGIQNALGFIQSSLPYPKPEGYKGFLTQLVCNLLDEGNAMFREGEWQQAINDFSEGVNVTHYAQAETLEIPSALLESLYFNRAAAYHSMGEYEQGVQDCDSALALCKDSCRALYRKALCLRELGRFREAYNCSTGCLLTTPNDKHVYELAQELANKLGLKIRKAYVSTKSTNGPVKLCLAGVAPCSRQGDTHTQPHSSPPVPCRCLVHAVRSSSVHYTKIRPLYTQCQLDVCRHAQRYGCQREDSCSFAHSVIELKCWRLQKDSGITHEEIVQESKRHWHKQEQNTHKPKPVYMPPPSSSSSGGGGGGAYILNLKWKFVCGQCWRDGLVSEPDKALKYCTAKARHNWTKERRVLLVKFFEGKKWVMVRTLPFAKTYPQQYDICAHVVKQKKCHYIGNCAFAHSEEEKQVWTYMKNNGLKDMQQMYDMWLTMTNQNRSPDDTLITQPVEEKQIVMPTDYAEPMSGFHCRLCGKHSNSERQWQQHISSEKHKDRVFSCEGEDESLTWTYRFPGLRLALCPRLESGCPEGVSCDYAHSVEELVEWQERREFLRRKLAKAREDMLIMPDEFDFGKYNFLLQD